MCGIVGFVDASVLPQTSLDRVIEMTDAIQHRGPDGRGLFQDPAVGLAMGMRRLSIIDLSGGDQPIWNESETVCVVFNGEIYNYIELRAKLIRLGHRFRTNSDTEVLVHGYEEYGASLVNKLRGMFAFAIYDRTARKLFLARDHFGQKPLYYCRVGSKFAFASEIKALLHLPWVPRDLSETAFFDYVTWHSVPAPETHYSAIRKFPAATSMLFDLATNEAREPIRYWEYFAAENGNRITKMADAADAVDAALKDSLKVHLRSDVPLGILLSGGLDSRAVATYSVNAQIHELQAFTIGYDVPGSEHLDAEKTAKTLGIRHHIVMVTPDDLATEIQNVAYHMDEPAADPAAFAVLKLCRLARQHVKVLLGGEGADELFGGYAERYRGMMQFVQKSNSLRWLSRFLPRTTSAFPSSRLGRLRQRIFSTQESDILSLRIEGFPVDVRDPKGLTATQLERVRHREIELSQRFCHNSSDLLAEMTGLDVRWQLADSLLLKADKMSMAASIELRCPFLDLEVAGVASRIDSKLKISGEFGKLPLRYCMERYHPGEISRPKKGFPIPLAEWFLGPLKEQVTSQVFREGAGWREFLDSKLIENAWESFAAGKTAFAKSFYALWLYESWRDSLKPVAVSA